MSKDNHCPEFPHFGAPYPDARCINGYLWDLDKFDDKVGLYGGGNDPCPFCNTQEYKEWLNYDEEGELGKDRIDKHIAFLNKKDNTAQEGGTDEI